MNIKTKVIIILSVVIAISFTGFYIHKLKSDIDIKENKITELKGQNDSLVKTINNNNSVFEKYKSDTNDTIKRLSELTKKDNDNQKKTDSQIKEALSTDYKKSDKKELKERLENQYNSIIGELNEM